MSAFKAFLCRLKKISDNSLIREVVSKILYGGKPVRVEKSTRKSPLSLALNTLGQVDRPILGAEGLVNTSVLTVLAYSTMAR